jgi:ATP-dependent protease HslVU (ClpYQ) peptidase subunit
VIYVIGEDYSWVRDITGVYSFGSGGDFAAGALFSLGADTPATSMMTTEKMIRKSLAVAARLDPGTGSPFHVVTQSQPLSKIINAKPKRARGTRTKDVIVNNKRRPK